MAGTMGFLNDLTSLQGSGGSLLRPAEPQDGDSDRDAAAGFLDTITAPGMGGSRYGGNGGNSGNGVSDEEDGPPTDAFGRPLHSDANGTSPSKPSAALGDAGDTPNAPQLTDPFGRPI